MKRLLEKNQITRNIQLFITVLFTMAGVFFSNPAFSHTLKQTSAQITLRDGQVELRLYINRDLWLTQLQDHQAWLTGLNSVLLLEDDLSSTDLAGKLMSVILTETTIRLDGYTVELATIKSDSNPLSDHLLEFRFSASHTLQNPSLIETTFAQSLGDVHLSVTRPIYRNLAQGSTVSLSLE
ncbi:hypothetical protein L4D20_06305 [Vibrio kyushuensis]|uniref:hypothetical protein n=1 Tax=Vibrio kyushuensis TaxID=2910249 RepID=UPI003D0B9889